jgi:uncharacterized protein (TIGR01319 family)
LRIALEKLRELSGIGEGEIKGAAACSSAAGGLKMVVTGLVPEYTTKAGNMAALGAGAKVSAAYSYELTSEELSEIDELKPDIALLTGGTDGGNRRTIIHNASALAASSVKNIVAAGNKSVADEIRAIFSGSGKNVLFTENVMPEFGVLNTEPVNRCIRELFISTITQAKGIDSVSELIGGVIMPTPAAVLEAVKLIAEGTDRVTGFGELMAVDVGGATTDVYSAANGAPTREGVFAPGMREPYAKRTVEGDLGLYHSRDTLIKAAGGGEPDELTLTRTAVSVAVSRHAGTLEQRVTGNGAIWVQRGKDLSGVKLLIGTGGPVVYSGNPATALTLVSDGVSLVPQSPKLLLDREYILFAVGLLSQSEPDAAMGIVRKYLTEI